MTEKELAHARDWLARRGASGYPPSGLLAARLAARARARQLEILLLTGVGLLVIGWALLVEVIDFSLELGPGGTELRGPLEMSVAYLLLTVVVWLAYQRQLAAERRIAEALPRRAAHSARHGVAEVVGRRWLSAGAVTYLGGVTVGLGLAILTDAQANRVVGLVVAAGTLVFAALDAVLTAKAVRRPAFAEDEASLRVDDLLRTADARRVPPFPLVVAAVAALNAVVTPAAMWALLGYAAVGALAWLPAALERPGRRDAVVGAAG
ncbi:hypothetical protein [Amycolatopsis arida]|uniref:hypothetical protein n=1 Tax=Amycolatopsis arida TaxID=587909 RepID=UPI001066EA42|nr:hypothetical protein [Amycolatopsis arida]